MPWNKRKAWGQNFLKNKAFLKKMAEILTIEPDDTIVEIGGGHGELSSYLLEAKRLIIYEIDKNLSEGLQRKFSFMKNVEIKNEDFLLADLESENLNHHYKLIGNLPYSITGLILRKVFDLKNYPSLFVFTAQKELAEKMLSGKSFWSHWLKIWGEIEKIDLIKNKNFSPQPKVDSVILKIKFYQKPLVENPEVFVQFLKKLFKQPKKMIKNNINLPKNFKHLSFLRPHQLSFNTILLLYQEFNKA